MRLVLTSLFAAAALSSVAFAQTSTSPSGSSTTTQPMNNTGSSAGSTNMNQSNTAGSGNAAVNNKPADSPQTTGSVEPGANSFTEDQVRSRFAAQGLMNVTDLRKDDQGIWRGKAMRNGQQVSVALDYKGTIQAQ
jgi:protein CpxP